MMWLRQAVGYGEPEQPRVSPIENNPVGWSSIYPPQVVTNPDPNVSPVVPKATMTPQALWGALLAGKRNQPVTGAELPALEQKANTAVDYGMAVAGATQPIRAFHGSPHTFDRFSLDKIGTGEGAQAYGHGLYFAGAEDTAKTYRDGLSGLLYNTTAGRANDQTIRGQMIQAVLGKGFSPEEARGIVDAAQSGLIPDNYNVARYLKKYDLPTGRFGEGYQVALDAVSELAPKKVKGSMYEVSLRTTPERLLDWDKPLSAQPQQVREAVQNAAQARLGEGTRVRLPTTEDIARGNFGNYTGDEAYTAAGGFRSGDVAEKATGRLLANGLDGIQYLDAGSRGAGEGSRNYVMFRDDIIDILKRYGLFGLGMMGAAGAQGGKEQ